MNAETIEAKILALQNAAAMIESHGEEGGIEQEDYDVDVDLYLKYCKVVAKSLYKEAHRLKLKLEHKNSKQ